MSVQVETSLREFVLTTLAAAANVERRALSEDTNVLDLGIDSLTLAAVVAQIEIQYGCEIPVDQLYLLIDAPLVRDLLTIVSRLVREAGGADEEQRAGALAETC